MLITGKLLDFILCSRGTWQFLRIGNTLYIILVMG